MTIGELAAAAGVTTKTIRFYEQQRLLPDPPRTASGYRDYGASALPRLQFVRSAQACGLTLAQVRQVIAVREETGAPCSHVATLLDTHLVGLDARIADLVLLREEVRGMRARAETLDPAACAPDTVCQILL